ncbi:MAG: AI-2E family transporter [Candidatus Promineifilaceae bacterium]
MAEDPTTVVSDKIQQDPLEQRVAESQKSWKRLGMRIRATTPASVARYAVATAAILLVAVILRSTWIALTPFIVGAVVAYVVLPFVNWLDKYLPRFLAVVIVLVGVVAFLALFLSRFAPIMGQQVYKLGLLLPDRDDIRAAVDDLREWYQDLPAPTQAVIDDLFDQAGQSVRVNLDSYFSKVVDLTISTILNLVNTIAFILGFLVVPAWLLAVLRDQRTGVKTVDGLMPEWMRADFWAFVRIADRTFRAFIDGQMVLGIIVGFFFYLGLVILEALGIKLADYKLVLAIFAGLMHLIPSVGPIIAGVLFFVGGSLTSLETGIALVALYFGIMFIVSRFVSPHFERRYINIHPAVLIVAIVALSEFGIFWVLLAAPVTAILRDTYRYIQGRLSEPPKPAGLLPDVPLPEGMLANEPEPSTIRVPIAYRRGPAKR